MPDDAFNTTIIQVVLQAIEVTRRILKLNIPMTEELMLSQLLRIGAMPRTNLRTACLVRTIRRGC
jgi:hypothetical protein